MNWFLCIFLSLVVSYASASEPEESVQPLESLVTRFEDMNVFDKYPDYVYLMTKDQYRRWVATQNKGAMMKAKKLSDKLNALNPPTSVFVRENNTTAYLDGSTHGFWGNPSRMSVSTSGRSYDRMLTIGGGWKGGPVLILNPYVDPPTRQETR